MTFSAFFKSLTGFLPFPYQERMADALLEEKSLLLRVPTGAGKTWAAVAPFLYALSAGCTLADRLIYTLPLRSLASSLSATVQEKMNEVFGQVLTCGKDRDYPTSTYSCSLQIGSQKNDPFFESDLVFTTIDQLLSGYILLPVSLPDRLGNINAGAIPGSLVVIDELHLLDPSVALGTLVEMLERLHDMCQFVLMSATMSDELLRLLATQLHARLLFVPDEEIRALPSQRTKRRAWRWITAPLTAHAVKEQHARKRSIVIMNSVRRAQDIFIDLLNLYKGEQDAPELILLHARFYPEDRIAIENQLARYFGPEATQSNVILVATQVIEAGIDISADHLHTELAAMNSLIQRAGRTARYEQRNEGLVSVYELQGLGPYKSQQRLIDATRSALQGIAGTEIDFRSERQLVEQVHGDYEREQLAQYTNLFSRRRDVHDAMDHGHRGKLAQLVREVDSVGTLISSEPEHLNFSGRVWPRLLSVPGVSLFSLREAFGSLPPGHWVVKGAEEIADDEHPGSRLNWRSLAISDLRSQWLVALHPDFASYHPQLGLRIGTGGPAPSVIYGERPPATRFQYEFETWVDHANRITAQACAMRPGYACGAQRLSRKFGMSQDRIEELVTFACVLHDVGKLTLEWQQCAWAWQNDRDARIRASGKSVPSRDRVPLAHTVFDPIVDGAFQSNPKYSFPPHAVQGAFAIDEALFDRFGPLAATCINSAIARHHGPRTKKCTTFRLYPGIEQYILMCLAGIVLFPVKECTNRTDADDFGDTLLRFGRETDQDAWPLFVFIVRRLRLADQASLRKNGEANRQEDRDLRRDA